MTEEKLVIWLEENKNFSYNDGYEQCTQKIFDEIKEKCIFIWTKSGLFNDEDYINEKLQIIEKFENFNADIMLMVNMFHVTLREHIIDKLSKNAQDYIKRYKKTIICH